MEFINQKVHKTELLFLILPNIGAFYSIPMSKSMLSYLKYIKYKWQGNSIELLFSIVLNKFYFKQIRMKFSMKFNQARSHSHSLSSVQWPEGKRTTAKLKLAQRRKPGRKLFKANRQTFNVATLQNHKMAEEKL